MNRHYRRPRRSRLSRKAGKLLPSLMLIVIGSVGFYAAMQWFRHDADQTVALAETNTLDTTASTTTSSPATVKPAAQVPVMQLASTTAAVKPETSTSAPLVSAFDGQHTGKVERYLNISSADFVVLAFLPALDMSANSYHVWLLKDGLADVKDMGQLAPRADGSWILNFTAGPNTGILDPSAYGDIVIMEEPNDGNPAPSGNRIAEARF